VQQVLAEPKACGDAAPTTAMSTRLGPHKAKDRTRSLYLILRPLADLDIVP